MNELRGSRSNDRAAPASSGGGSIEGSRDLVARARSRDKTLRELPDFYHDILHEPGGDALPAEIAAWIRARAAH